MTGDDGRRHSRRAVLAGLAGTALTAGCLGGDEDDHRELDPGPLQSISSTPGPSVPRRLPVPIGAAHLEKSVRRARELLSVLPDSIGTAEIPNGAIREEVVDARGSATDGLDRAESAPTPFERMQALRDARQSAATASAAWLAIDGNHSRADVVSARPDLAERLAAFQDEWRYVGGEPIPTVLVCRELEGLTRQARDHLDRSRNPRYVEPDSPPGIGRVAGDLEYARCAIADAEHVYHGWTTSVDGTTQSIEGPITDAARQLTELVADRAAELPAEHPDDQSSLVERDVADTPTGRVVTTALRNARRQADGPDDRRNAGEYATAILDAHEALTAIDTYATLRDRIADGEDFPIDTAEDVLAYRRDAVEAVREALETSENPRLDRTAAGRLARAIGYVDASFESIDADSTPSVAQIERDTARYVRLGTAAGVIPTVSDTVAAELEGA